MLNKEITLKLRRIEVVRLLTALGLLSADENGNGKYTTLERKIREQLNEQQPTKEKEK